MGFALTSMRVTSEAFGQDERIPAQHTGEGMDVSPALAWRDAPADTKAYAVFCHDPDAPLVKPGTYGFAHWVLYNIPATASGVAENTSEGTQGMNDFGQSGFNGPMPPEGHGKHRYYFWVLALDQTLDLPDGLSLDKLLEKVEPHVLGMNRLVGIYQRD